MKRRKTKSRLRSIRVKRRVRKPTKRKITRARRNPRHVTFKTKRGAETHLKKLRVAYPEKEFGIVPSGFRYAVGIFDPNSPRDRFFGRTASALAGRITRTKRNPYRPYFIIGKDVRGATWYYSVNGGFTKHKKFAELMNSLAVTHRVMRRLVNRLPSQIGYIAARRA